LVVLKTSDTYRTNTESNRAITAATEILDNRGASPRIYRNMLAFVAPDNDLMPALKQGVKEFLAWKSIVDEKESLNLDVAQSKEADGSLHRSNETVDVRIREAYCWLLSPYIDRDVDLKSVQWEATRISGGNDGIVKKAANKLLQNEALITKWAPALLLMELDNILWKEENCIQIKKLWEYLCTYCYLPRLARYSVLEDAIQTGLNSREYFAIAAGRSNERFVDLKFDQYVGFVQGSDYLVKKMAALEQIAMEAREVPAPQIPTTPPDPSTGVGGYGPVHPKVDDDKPLTPTTPTQPKNTRFYMSAQLDTTRINRDVQRLVEEVISHLTSADGYSVEVTLEVNVNAPDGLPAPIVRTVMENCRTLKVKNFGVDQ